MARHRAIRNAKSYDYDDFDEYYGHSYEDDYCVSPGTLAQYSYRQSDVGLAHFIPSESTVEEENEQDFDDTANGFQENYKAQNGYHQHNNAQSSYDESSVLMDSCLEKIRDVVGENYTDKAIKNAISKYNFDTERAINFLISSPEIKTVTTNAGAGNKPITFFFSSEKPLEQRQPRNRRRDQQATVTTIPQANAQQSQKKPEVTKVRNTGNTPIKTGFETNFSNTDNEKFDSQSSTAINLLTTVTDNVTLTPNSKASSSSVANNEKNIESYRISKKAAQLNAAHEHRKQNNKPQISMVVIGHVDAGKSTLMGHILFKCGEVSKKTMHKYEKESKKVGKSSFAYAWILDETEEERSRGVTMDIGLTRFETENRSVVLLDAPGHKDFIPNMISGASQADVALLVINATTGEFEAGFDLGGQTREHSLLVRSLGVSQLAVAVNKLDTVEWSENRFKEIVKKLKTFLKQAGFKENEVTYIPVSGLVGENLTTPSETEQLTKWYKGPCLIDVINDFKPPNRPVDYPLRFCVTDVYKGQGTGIQVSGRIETGGISSGDKAIILPAGETALVKGIEMHDNSKCEVALAGDHVTLNCHGVDIMKIQTGNVISSIQNQIAVVMQFQARIIVFNTELPITKGFSVELLYKAAAEPAVIRKLINILHKSTGEVQTKRPKMLQKGQNAMVLIEVFRPICIEEYSKVKEMGRFTLRYSGSTIAGGVVTKLIKK